MQDKIVITENISKFVTAVQSLMSKPARSDKMGLIIGKWGLGKSTALEWFFTNHACFYVRAWAAWSRSANWMVEDILKCYRVEAKGTLKHDLRELIRVVKKNRFPLFIDECDRVVKKSILIETLRDIHDITRVPIILIGQEDIVNMLQRRDLGPIYSRITEIAEFKPLSAEDIQNICDELCDLKCNSEVASFIKVVSLGDFRLVNAFLVRAENLCTLNKTKEISLQIAKEASKILPNSDDSRKPDQELNVIREQSEPMRAAQ